MSLITQQEIIKLVELQFGAQNVRPNDRLVEDLKAESADIANLIALVEEKFNIVIKESEIARVNTPADLFELVQKRTHAS
jgi:acyl carrier protein